MKQLIINCKTGEQEYSDMTPGEEAQRLKDIALAIAAEAIEQEKAQQRTDALERLRASGKPDILDLLKAINLA